MPAIAAELLGLGEELGARLAPVEEGDLVTPCERRLDGRAAQELRPAENEELHDPNRTFQACGFLTRSGAKEYGAPVRLRSLNEAECYARCYGEGDDNVRSVRLEPRRPRFDLDISGEDLRRAFEVRLDKREPQPGPVAESAVEGHKPAAAA